MNMLTGPVSAVLYRNTDYSCKTSAAVSEKVEATLCLAQKLSFDVIYLNMLLKYMVLLSCYRRFM